MKTSACFQKPRKLVSLQRQSRGAGGAGGACLVVTPGAAQDPGLYAAAGGLDADADAGGLDADDGDLAMQLIASFIAVCSLATTRIPAQSKPRD